MEIVRRDAGDGVLTFDRWSVCSSLLTGC